MREADSISDDQIHPKIGKEKGEKNFDGERKRDREREGEIDIKRKRKGKERVEDK